MTDPVEPTTGLTGEPEEGVTSPAHRPVASLDYGTTTREQIVGEPLDGRIARELPDPTLEAIESIEAGAGEAGIGSDEDAGGSIASAVGMDDGALS